MRFMILVKANQDSEAGKMPSQDMLTAMTTFNEELANAGVLLAGEGLHPSSRGKRVTFSGDACTVIDGPFGETQSLIAGFWLWQCQSMDEALDWTKHVPFHEGEIEIRQVFEAADFGAEFTPELQAREERLRAQAAPRAQGAD